MTSDDIKRRRWTKTELEAARRIAAQQATGDDSSINYDEIPRLTEEQLAKMAPLRNVRPKVPVSVPLDRGRNASVYNEEKTLAPLESPSIMSDEDVISGLHMTQAQRQGHRRVYLKMLRLQAADDTKYLPYRKKR